MEKLDITINIIKNQYLLNSIEQSLVKQNKKWIRKKN